MHAGYVAAIVGGVALIALSRTVADTFRVPGGRSTFIKMGGLGDDYVSPLYRWFVCVTLGLVCIGLGVVGLLWR